MTATELAWTLDVFVPGKPMTKGNLTGFRMGTRIKLTEKSGTEQRLWSALVRDAVAEDWADPAWHHVVNSDRPGPTGRPVALDIEFVMPRRKSAPKTRTDPHIRKPDADKLTRAIMDALTHVVWIDDAQVVKWSGAKREAEIGETPGARIRVALLPERNAT